MDERIIRRAVRQALVEHGVVVFGMTGAYGAAGAPDFVACIGGKFVGIEVKCPGKKPSQRQQHWLDAINAAGGVGVVITDAAQIPPLVEALK